MAKKPPHLRTSRPNVKKTAVWPEDTGPKLDLILDPGPTAGISDGDIENPFHAQHAATETEYAGGEYTHSRARATVAREYEGREHAMECGRCGEMSGYYRATVGAWFCVAPECGAMRNPHSPALWTLPTKPDENMSLRDLLRSVHPE